MPVVCATMRGGDASATRSFAFVMEPSSDHRLEHELRAPLGGRRNCASAQAATASLHEAGEQRRFGKRQLPRRFAEIALRSLLDAVGAGAEIDAVEIKLEDLRLGEFAPPATAPAPAPGACGPSVRSCVRKRFFASCCVMVEPPWLTPRCRTLAISARADAERIDAEMIVEAPVLDGDERPSAHRAAVPSATHAPRPCRRGSRAAGHACRRS